MQAWLYPRVVVGFGGAPGNIDRPLATAAPRIIFTPSIELDLPLADDEATLRAAFSPKLEIGGRLSYDLIDRAISPYVGIHWERTFGESGRLVKAEGEDNNAVSLVVGLKLMF